MIPSMRGASVRLTSATRVPRNVVCEIELTAGRELAEPWGEIELDVEFVDPDGRGRTVPAFWDGGRTWRVRYSSPIEGVHGYRSVVRAEQETGLEGLEGDVTVIGYTGTNPLLLHGPPAIAADGTHLMHADGTPFLWLADTWWSATTARFRWPDTFQTLADDRAAKGFNVVQLVAGFVPEFLPFSPEMASEGGQPWLGDDPGTVNPAYWPIPDRKLDYLVEKGIAPCVVGAWGYWAGIIGREAVIRHWRYLVARYAAYPVVWCIAGEVDLARLHGDVAIDPDAIAEQVGLWEDVSRLVGEIDPFERIRTVHPCPVFTFASSEVFASRDSFELDMMQTGHTGRNCVPATMEHLIAALAHGDKPVLNGECSYEGIFDSCWQDVQRFLFWSHMLCGAAGHTYGTMAISTFNAKDDPHVPLSRVSMHYWEDAIDWLGSTHVGVGKRILERLVWWRLQPCQAAVEPHAGPDDWFLPYAARTPDDTLVLYVPGLGMINENDWVRFATLTVAGLRPGAGHRATFVDPRSGTEHSSLRFTSADDGSHTLTSSYMWVTPTAEDWVIVITPDR